MAKSSTKFICQQCGFESVKWMGKCPDCGEWNSFAETVVESVRGSTGRGSSRVGVAMPVPLTEVQAIAHKRSATGSPEMDRVLGGGLVPGSLVLLGGEPGIGKSTLLLQVAGDLALRAGGVLYVCAEESPQQIRMRAERLGIQTPELLLLAETDIEAIAQAAEQAKPSLMIVDSIQTVAAQHITSAPGASARCVSAHYA